jgi:hypothetical protein
MGAKNPCDRARLGGLGDTTNQIIADHLGSGSVVVTIRPTDRGFKSSGCGAWKLR